MFTTSEVAMPPGGFERGMYSLAEGGCGAGRVIAVAAGYCRRHLDAASK
jgi:hypothetical protein